MGLCQLGGTGRACKDKRDRSSVSVVAVLLCKHQGLGVGKQGDVVGRVWGKGWDHSWRDGGTEQRVPASPALPDLDPTGRRQGADGGFIWKAGGCPPHPWWLWEQVSIDILSGDERRIQRLWQR